MVDQILLHSFISYGCMIDVRSKRLVGKLQNTDHKDINTISKYIAGFFILKLEIE